MTCDEVAALQAALADGEVDGLRAHALRRHLAGCPACAQQQDALRALRAHLRTELSRHTAPPGLRQRVSTVPVGVVTGAGAAKPGPPRLRWPRRPALSGGRWRDGVGGALAGAMLASALWTALPALDAWFTARDTPSRLVDLHTRAMLSNRQIDVASSDRHTVKPWLSARLDYAPPVMDASAAGFALLGGRIDRLDGHAVAVLVYRQREHLIDVLVRPEPAPAVGAVTAPVRGFNLALARGAGMQWLAVSDLNAAELGAFLQRLARGEFDPVPG